MEVKGVCRQKAKVRSPNVGVMHGVWGETVAANYLRRHGFVIVEQNVCPVAADKRLELDIVAWERKSDTMVFVEVKQHAKLSCYSRRLRSICRRKKQNQLRASNAWRRVNKWRGAYRFDVLEVYGVPECGEPIVDHIENVQLFVKSDRFVNWK